MLRSFLFNVLFYSWTALLAIAGAPVLLAPRPKVLAFARFWVRGIEVLLRYVAGITYEVRGRDRVPGGQPIFAIKHQSAFETLIAHLIVRDPAIMLKRELTLIPFFGWFLLRSGMIPIDRRSGGAAIRSMVRGGQRAVAERSSIVIFPEGTRVPPDADVPYLPGVAALYTQLGRPVVPVALNAGLYWGRRSFRKRPGRILIEFLPPIPPGLERRHFMAELRGRLEPATAALVAEGRQVDGVLDADATA